MAQIDISPKTSKKQDATTATRRPLWSYVSPCVSLMLIQTCIYHHHHYNHDGNNDIDDEQHQQQQKAGRRLYRMQKSRCGSYGRTKFDI
jgi:hypothetical protein